MPYPKRGAWVFYNVRRATSFWPTLESIQISQEFPDVVATMTCEVVDPDSNMTFAVEDEVRVTFDGDRIFAGHLKVVTEDRADEFGPRIWRLEAQDYTAKLGDAIIRQQKQRKKESALRRIRWIVSYLDAAWHLDGHDYDVPDEDVERKDMFGMTVAEALDSVANEVGLRYWIDLDNHLHVEKATTTAAPFDLDNVSPNLTTTFPFREFSYRRDSTELANAVLVEPEKRKDSRWAVAQANIDLYEWGDSTGRQELFIAAEEIRTARAAERHADVQLQRAKAYEGEATLVCFQPGIWAGMTVNVTEALWDHDAPFKVVRVDISAVDPHDSNGTAYMRCELTLNNKRKRRKPKIGRTEGEKAEGASRRKAVDRFSRISAAREVVAGDAIGATVTKYGIKTTFLRYGAGAVMPGQGVLQESGPSVTGPYTVPSISAMHAVGSYIGTYATPWTQRVPGVSPCGGLDFWFAGWEDIETWYKFTVPAHPVGVAGISGTLHADLSGPSGLAGTYGIDVVALGSAPSGTWQGTVIAHIPDGGNAVFNVPLALVPAEGGEMWIGLRAAWKCNYGQEYCGWGSWPRWNGAGNSGFYSSPPWVTSLAWATWSTPVDWGSTEDGDEWEDAGTEGSPTTGIDGEAWYVTGPGGQGIAVEGSAEGEMDGTWSSVSWAVKVRFTADALAAGGSITLTTTGQGQQTIGTIDLGTAPAISVGGPTTTDSEAVAIGAGETWFAKFDSRSGAFRGKVWRVYAPEPALWDVEVPMSETEDDADRFEMWVRSGTGQTIRVLDIESFAAARPGEEVVTEYLGVASGDTNRFVTNHRYRGGTLIPWVLGVADPATQESGATTEFVLDFYPTTGSPIHASYVAAASHDEPSPGPEFGLTTEPRVYSVASDSATVEWTMSEVCTGQVEYGLTSAYGDTTTEQPISGGYETHVQAITGLTAATTYHFRTKSTNAAGVTVYSDDMTLATDGAITQAGPRAAPALPATYVVVPASVPSNGTDCSAAMQSFIDSVPDGSTIVFDKTLGGAGTTYTMSTGIMVRTREDLTFWGYGATIDITRTDGANAGAPFTVRSGSDGITILGFELQGRNTPLDFLRLHTFIPYEGGAGVRILVARNVTVQDCRIHNLNGDGIYVSGEYITEVGEFDSGGKGWSTIGPFDFSHNHIFQMGRQGIVPNWGTRYDITWNLIEDVAAWPVDTEDGEDIRRVFGEVYVTDNIFRRWNWWANYVPRAINVSHDTAQVLPMTRYEILRNRWEYGAQGYGNPDSGILPSYSSQYWISFWGSGGKTAVKVANMVVSDNVAASIPANQLTTSNGAMRVQNVTNLTVTDNTFLGLHILHVRTSGTVTISGNGASVVRTS